MSRWITTGLVILLVLAALPAAPAQAQTVVPECKYSGEQEGGALYCITMPPDGYWNGDLVIFAHGYVAKAAPLDIPWSQMTFVNAAGDTVYMPDVINGLGFAFATTSYRENGLAVQEGIADILDLIDVFGQQVAPAAHVYLVGASEGGLVTTLAIEQRPDKFSGGLATCGPIGSFTGQVNYWGDFRVLFDYFMDLPKYDVLPGSAVNIPENLMTKWDSVYTPRILASLILRPLATKQLMAVSQSPFDATTKKTTAKTIAETTLGILWYNVFATNDAVEKLGGQPFDNSQRKYKGSYADFLLNRRIPRYTADSAALDEIAANYETSGNLLVPLVTMHTTGDPIVPGWQQTLYAQKVLMNNPLSPYVPNEIDRYGHCAFTLDEVQASFMQLLYLATGELPPMMPMRTTDQPVEDPYYYDYK